MHSITLQSGEGLEHGTRVGGAISLILTGLGAYFLGKEFIELGVAGVSTIETLVPASDETINDVIYFQNSTTVGLIDT